jgi:hypothetical protein
MIMRQFSLAFRVPSIHLSLRVDVMLLQDRDRDYEAARRRLLDSDTSRRGAAGLTLKASGPSEPSRSCSAGLSRDELDHHLARITFPRIVSET